MRRLSIFALLLSLSGCVGGVGLGSAPSAATPAGGDTTPIAAPAAAPTEPSGNGAPVDVTVTPPADTPTPADPGYTNGPVVPANINPAKLRPPSP